MLVVLYEYSCPCGYSVYCAVLPVNGPSGFASDVLSARLHLRAYPENPSLEIDRRDISITIAEGYLISWFGVYFHYPFYGSWTFRSHSTVAVIHTGSFSLMHYAM